jgi:hypothetical protein
MSQFKLQLVRMDCNHVVLTEHPDRIHPRDLSVWLVDKYGAAHVKISLRRNIYVIYIDREVIDNGEIVSGVAPPEGNRNCLIYDGRAHSQKQIWRNRKENLLRAKYQNGNEISWTSKKRRRC